MRILLDTNVIIPLEDSSGILNESLSDLARLANAYHHELLIHPTSLEELNRDTNLSRKKINLSRAKKYSELHNPPALVSSEREILNLNENNENDKSDNLILFSVYKNAAGILVTEDINLHKKAAKLGLSSRVHYIQQATSFLKRLHERHEVHLPNIKERLLHEIDLGVPFFDSLRQGYPGFNEWYTRSSQAGRKAWVVEDAKNRVEAICIYKEEQDPIITDNNSALRGKVLKLCTFKVGENIRGQKIGELIFKTSFQYASKNQYEYIYVTMRPNEQKYLGMLCEDFGFEEFGNYQGDTVFVKKHPVSPPSSSVEPVAYVKKFFPHFKAGTLIGKYIVPIQPQFHKKLFPDNQSQQSLFGAESEGNAIKKAYLCHSNLSGISPGDILLFYRSEDAKAITSIGIVEVCEDTDSLERIMELVSKRTVYNYDELVVMSEKKTKVILFRLTVHLTNPIPYNWLRDNNVVNGSIQTIRHITHDSFIKIVNEARIENCLFTN